MVAKVKVDISVSRELYGSQEYTVTVNVTNVGDRILSSIDVQPHLFAGTLISQEESDSISELDELQEKKHRILKEMEEQVAAAYERKRLRELGVIDRFFIGYARLPDVVAAMITGNQPRLFRIPHYATEATKIDTVDDIDRIERVFFEKEEEDSLLRQSFQADKDKLQAVLEKIASNSSTTDSSDERIRLLVGDAISFSFRYRAPNLYRQQSMEFNCRISYRESESSKVGMISAGESLYFYASPFAVPFGAILGAIVGFIVKSTLMVNVDWFTGPFFIALSGSVALALIVAFATSRDPKKRKIMTVEDFVGGFVIGALAAMFSGKFVAFLESFLPTA